MSLQATNQNKSVSELLEGLIKSHSLVPWSTDDVCGEAWLYQNNWFVLCARVSNK